MKKGIFGAIPAINEVAQNIDLNKKVPTPAPATNPQPVGTPAPAAPTIEGMVKRNLFRVDPTAQQAAAVGASQVTPEQVAQQLQQQQQAQVAQQTQKTPVRQTSNNTTRFIDPTDPNAGMAYLNSLYTNPEDEDKMRRSSVANQRILALGDALRQIGNIYHTVGGAPSQQFNDPVELERARYEKGKALRDAANMKYYSYQAQKAKQDAQMRKLELEAANTASQITSRQQQIALTAEKNKLQAELLKLRQKGEEAKAKEIETRINRINELLPGEKRLQDARVEQSKASANASNASAGYNKARTKNPKKYGSAGVAGYKVIKRYEPNEYGPYGNLIKKGKETIERVPTNVGDEEDDEFSDYLVGNDQDDDFSEFERK